MAEVTRILSQIDQGDPSAAGRLLPLVYEELRRLAAQKLAQEAPGQTLQATALVHEAYIRMVDVNSPQHWRSRGHFFGAAAEAMRRILVEQARRKRRIKHGGGRRRVELSEVEHIACDPRDDVIAIHEALDALAEHDAIAAELVKLRYFAGLTLAEAAMGLGISTRTADRLWTYAKARLHERLCS